MTAGSALLAEGVEVPIKGGQTARLLFDMYSFVKLEEEFGGLGAVATLIPKGEFDVSSLPPDLFTKLMKILHLGFLHLDWKFEETCHNLLPRHLAKYFEALSSELNFSEEADSPGPKQP